MQQYKITLVGDAFHIEGFPDAVKAIAISGLSPHLPKQLADCALNRGDLVFAKECADLLTNPDIKDHVIREALWRSAIVYYCKCFDHSGSMRAGLRHSKYLPQGEARAAHKYFIDLRNKHLIHDENSYTQVSIGAIIGPAGKHENIEEVICATFIGNTLNDNDLGLLRRLINEALQWVQSRFDELIAKIKGELEKQPYDTLLAQPEMTPYRAPTIDQVSKQRTT